MGESPDVKDAIEAKRQKLATQLLAKRMKQAAQAQANLERALEMSRSVDVSDIDLDREDLEVDDAELYDVDLDNLDFDDDVEDLDEELEELESRIDEIEDELQIPEEELDDDLELLESRMDDLDEVLESSRHHITLDADDEAELLAAVRANEQEMQAKRRGLVGSSGESVRIQGTADSLARLAAGLKESARRHRGKKELQLALELLDGLSGQVGAAAPRVGSNPSLRDLLTSYLDMARVMAAAGTALALLVEEKLSEGDIS